MAFEVPVIETGRLILREQRLEDFYPYAEMWAHPDVTRFTTGKPLSREDAWAKFARMSGFWALSGYGFWALEEKASGAFIGQAGLADFRRDIEPSLDGKPEFGWGLTPAAQGKGYATEAISAALDWAQRTLPARTYCCIIDPANEPSIRVADRCGFERRCEAIYKNTPIAVFERTAFS
jgi:RimJ/RimL family protein N-acetyltransferase